MSSKSSSKKAKTPAKAVKHPVRKPAAPAKKVSPSAHKPAHANPAVHVHHPAPAAAKKEAALSAQELKELKDYLLNARKETLTRLQEKKTLDMPEAEVGDPIDVATQNLDKELLFEVTDNEHQMLEQIEAALRRIEKGVFGICESCRAPIPTKRIKAMPFARYCITCQNSNEVLRAAPPAEQA